jgi:hypothetical protein
LTVEEYEAAKEEAARLGISLAELLRRSLRTMLGVTGVPLRHSRGLERFGSASA